MEKIVIHHDGKVTRVVDRKQYDEERNDAEMNTAKQISATVFFLVSAVAVGSKIGFDTAFHRIIVLSVAAIAATIGYYAFLLFWGAIVLLILFWLVKTIIFVSPETPVNQRPVAASGASVASVPSNAPVTNGYTAQPVPISNIHTAGPRESKLDALVSAYESNSRGRQILADSEVQRSLSDLRSVCRHNDDVYGSSENVQAEAEVDKSCAKLYHLIELVP